MANPADICPRPIKPPNLPTQPHATPIYAASVWECASPAQADAILSGQQAGYVYQRDGHPNAHVLSEKLKRLHGAEQGIVTGSGMGALAAALLATLQAGDHAVVGSRLYGKTLALFQSEASRLGMEVATVDTCDLAATKLAVGARTKLILAETIANPLLEVADVSALAEIASAAQAVLLLDNTFASPIVCRPLELGAGLVMESLTKTLNGHSDVILGFLGGCAECWERVPAVVSTWGLASSPFDCWLAERGLATAHLRIERACENALAAAEFLARQPQVEQVHYPGLPEHPQHALARAQFGQQFGTIVSFRLIGGRRAADAFIAAAAERIPFCPSLGEVATTLSHPESTSHRGMPAGEREKLGITGGTIRLSVGTESRPFICDALRESLSLVG